MSEKLVLTPRDATSCDVTLIGGKAANLAWLTSHQFNVPAWLVLTRHLTYNYKRMV